jgi:uncharacterized membrane protein
MTKSPAKPVDERIQKRIDAALYAGGRPSAQKIRNFLNGTWLGEPLHVVLKDVPIGAWTVAMFFDVFDSIGNTREFALAAEASIAIGILGAVGAAATGLTDWSDVDPPARKMGLLHGVLNVGATALFTTSLLLRRNKTRAAGRVAAALGYALMTYSAHLGGKMVYKLELEWIAQTDWHFRKTSRPFCQHLNWPMIGQLARCTTASLYCLFVADSVLLPWRTRARTSVDPFRRQIG